MIGYVVRGINQKGNDGRYMVCQTTVEAEEAVKRAKESGWTEVYWQTLYRWERW